MLVQAHLAAQKGLKEGGCRHLRPSPRAWPGWPESAAPVFCVRAPHCVPGTSRLRSECRSHCSHLSCWNLLEWAHVVLLSGSAASPLSRHCPGCYMGSVRWQSSEIVDAGPFFTLLVVFGLGGWWEQPQELPTMIFCIWSVTVLYCPSHVCLWIDKCLRYVSFFFFFSWFLCLTAHTFKWKESVSDLNT